ncbi:MAG: class II glutamine amidotransferase [Burkholderiales bacterium]|nr:class II glutamine amidotransferase [Burkholderiales bacterium]
MCQLLGMNCNTPTDITFSFEGFSQRGGKTDHHGDGWGIAFFEDNCARLFLDHRPAVDSAMANFIKQYPLRSLNVIAHIRKATKGDISLRNCHPFQRELWGQTWVFAHNGNLENFEPDLDGSYLPIGETDSERAFCLIMQVLRQTFGACIKKSRPSIGEIVKTIEPLIRSISTYGTFNMLLSNGEAMYCFCATELHSIVRQHPFDTAHLSDCDMSLDFSTVTGENDRVALIATRPLTDNEIWQKHRCGEFRVFVSGQTLLSR